MAQLGQSVRVTTAPGRTGPAASEFAIRMPCLNEAETLGRCIAKARGDGAALIGGIEAGRSPFVIMGDSDDFSDLEPSWPGCGGAGAW